MSNMYMNQQQPQTFGSTQPYGYNMGTTPMPMSPQPNQTLPPLYPSLLTPQLNPPKPFVNNNLQQAQYAQGGAVDGMGNDQLSALLEALAAYQGGREDTTTVTARPGELMPHYARGGLKGLARRVVRIGAPVAGSIFGGPIGAGLGGALGAALTGRNPLHAGLFSAGVSSLLPSLAGLIGGPQAAGQTGSMFGLGGVGDLLGSTAAKEGVKAGAGGVLGTGISPGLAGLGLIGLTAMSRKKVPPETQTIGQALSNAQPQWREDQAYHQATPSERVRRILTPEEERGDVARRYYEEPDELYHLHAAHGGSMNYLDGSTGGQDDKINAALSDGEYVLSADVVSGLGDGNNKAGAKKLDKFMANVRAHKTSKGGKGLAPKAKSLESYMRGR